MSCLHYVLFVINLLSDREEWGVNVYDGGESPSVDIYLI